MYTLLEVFDATRDLYETLTKKDKRDHEQHLRSKGYPNSRKLEFIDDSGANGNRAILTDKLALLRRYEDGLRDVGSEFAVGDGKDNYLLVRGHILTFISVVACLPPVSGDQTAGCTTYNVPIRPYIP